MSGENCIAEVDAISDKDDLDSDEDDIAGKDGISVEVEVVCSGKIVSGSVLIVHVDEVGGGHVVRSGI